MTILRQYSRNDATERVNTLSDLIHSRLEPTDVLTHTEIAGQQDHVFLDSVVLTVAAVPALFDEICLKLSDHVCTTYVNDLDRKVLFSLRAVASPDDIYTNIRSSSIWTRV